MRTIIVAILATTIFASSVLAGTGGPGAPGLSPGKPAGVDQAQAWDLQTLGLVALGMAVVGGFSLLIASESSSAGTVMSFSVNPENSFAPVSGAGNVPTAPSTVSSPATM